MGFFGRKPLPYGLPDYMAPGGGIGGGLPGADGAIDYSVPEDPYEGERPAKPGFFGKGGAWKDVLGEGLGAIAQQFGGSNPYEQGRDREHEMALLRLRSELEGDNPQAINLGDGGVGTWSRDGGFNIVREPTPGDNRTTAQQNWEFLNSLPEDQRDKFRSTLGGYGYTPGGIEAQGQIATNRAKAGAQYRAPPRSGGGGGGGVTPTARARAIGEAERAIAQGADRNAVYARLAKMGIR